MSFAKKQRKNKPNQVILSQTSNEIKLKFLLNK